MNATRKIAIELFVIELSVSGLIQVAWKEVFRALCHSLYSRAVVFQGSAISQFQSSVPFQLDCLIESIIIMPPGPGSDDRRAILRERIEKGIARARATLSLLRESEKEREHLRRAQVQLVPEAPLRKIRKVDRHLKGAIGVVEDHAERKNDELERLIVSYRSTT